ncbi:MAG: divalent-cation tolerance protein CutA [Akkermansiaceae bacterium]|nr:divalent-cation tolerance protein CutA [Akkermansiaceae bacterium]
MENLLIVFCTFPDADSARQIGTLLVEKQLAACVNLLPAVESIYRWEGNIETSTEILAIYKTTEAVFPEFEKSLSEIHPYQVPEIIALEPTQVAEKYRAWVVDQTNA